MKKFSNVVEMVREANQQELSDLQKSYREYFGAKLKKFNVESPADLNDEQKKEFFNEIKKDWEKGSGAKPAGKKDVEEHGVKENETVSENESVNESLWIAGGLVILTVLGIKGIKTILDNMRIERKMNKEVSPDILKKIVNELWAESEPLISAAEKNKAKAWVDETLRRIDAGDFKTVNDINKTLPASFMEWQNHDVDADSLDEAKINEKDIKNKEDFAKFVKDKLKKVHGDDFDEEKAQKVIDGLAKDAEKSGDWGAAVGKLNKA